MLEYTIGAWTWLGNLANIARMELAEVQNTEAQAHAFGDLSRAIPNADGNIGTAHHAQLATQQALGARMHLLRRTVKIVAPALFALCILGLWLALH